MPLQLEFTSAGIRTTDLEISLYIKYIKTYKDRLVISRSLVQISAEVNENCSCLLKNESRHIYRRYVYMFIYHSVCERQSFWQIVKIASLKIE